MQFCVLKNRNDDPEQMMFGQLASGQIVFKYHTTIKRNDFSALNFQITPIINIGRYTKQLECG